MKASGGREFCFYEDKEKIAMATDLIEHQKLSAIIENYELVQKEVKQGFELLASAKDRLGALFGDYRDDIFHERISDRYLRDTATESAKLIQREAWEYLIDHLQLKSIMSEAAKKHLEGQIKEDRLPEITHANVVETLRLFMENANRFFEEAVKEVFNFLIPRRFASRYKTNQRFKIGRKVIIPFSVDWPYHIQCGNEQHFRALDNVFHRLDGKGTPKYPSDLVTVVNAAIRDRKTAAATPYFKCKWYRNGNMHVEFLRPDLLKQLNLRGGDHEHVPGPEEKTF